LQTDRRAAQRQRARVGRKRAGDEVDQRALAGAIFAEEHVDFAGAQIEVDVVERENARKPLADAGQPQDFHGVGGRSAARFGSRHEASRGDGRRERFAPGAAGSAGPAATGR
jgi:hypothetical protein